MGRLTLNVLLSFAQFEREVTAERVRDKIAASKAPHQVRARARAASSRLMQAQAKVRSMTSVLLAETNF